MTLCLQTTCVSYAGGHAHYTRPGGLAYLDRGADCQPCVVQRLDLDKDWGRLGERRWRGCMGQGGEGKGRGC